MAKTGNASSDRKSTAVTRGLVALSDVAGVEAYVDFACLASTGELALIGWIYDPESQVRGFALAREVQSGVLARKGYQFELLKAGVGGVELHRVARPDVAVAMSADPQLNDLEHGFVLVVPRVDAKLKLVLALEDGRCVRLSYSVLSNTLDISNTLPNYWHHSGKALRSALESALSADNTLARLIAFIDDGRGDEIAGAGIAVCDQALLLNDRMLLVQGWIGLGGKALESVELVTPRLEIDITASLHRTMRVDLAPMFPWASENPAGYFAVVEHPALGVMDLRLRVRGAAGERQVLDIEPRETDWPGVAKLIREHPEFEGPLLHGLGRAQSIEKDANRLAERIANLRRDNFRARYAQLPEFTEQPHVLLGGLDGAFALGDAGILVFGWQFSPRRQPRSVTIRSSEGEPVEISEFFVSLVRVDVSQALRPRFPHIGDWCGFMCLAPMPTLPGEARAICFDFADHGEVWLRVPADRCDLIGVDLIRHVLDMIPAPERMRHKLYDLFSRGLGRAVEVLNSARANFSGLVEERQFGVAPAKNRCSVIVPLYGRCDFLRFQLAQFADDADFAETDLVYVVDDPRILSETLELAARCQPLFGLPFRVIWYGENCGFAGANNIGVSVARGEKLVLLNSDVIPQAPGWISTLLEALDTLPDAGAVGPLLLFGDNSIQHAGMYPRAETMYPGFLLNSHKAMGTLWEGGDEPSEHPMLTAACLALNKEDFARVGGFDEGYVVGDFEDSDLCLALRKLGKRLWLVPEARLWHLERQSQVLGQQIGQRQMITLFNGWRYKEKIRSGELFNPVDAETV